MTASCQVWSESTSAKGDIGIDDLLMTPGDYFVHHQSEIELNVNLNVEECLIVNLQV